jgi:hypothetical protein
MLNLHRVRRDAVCRSFAPLASSLLGGAALGARETHGYVGHHGAKALSQSMFLRPAVDAGMTKTTFVKATTVDAKAADAIAWTGGIPPRDPEPV